MVIPNHEPMKTRILFTFGLASIVMLAGSFTVREKEEALKPSVDYYLLQGDKAFTSFVSNIQKMEALVYIPKSKLVNVRSMGISLLSRDKAAVMNKQIAASGDFVQLYPSSESGEEVTLNFEKLDMVCYVNRRSGSDDWKNADKLKIKWNAGPVFHKVESVTVDAARPEELQIKWDGNKVFQAYVPVTINDVPTIR